MLTSEDLKIVGQYVDNEPEQDHRVEQNDDNSNSASTEVHYNKLKIFYSIIYIYRSNQINNPFRIVLTLQSQERQMTKKAMKVVI
jgi:hypothetical protein